MYIIFFILDINLMYLVIKKETVIALVSRYRYHTCEMLDQHGNP